MLVYNASLLTQCVDIPNIAFPMFVHPGCVIVKENYKNLVEEFFKPFKFEILHTAKTLTLIRKYALGDIIQLVPVIRKAKEIYGLEKIVIVTVHQYLDLKHLFKDIIWATEDSIASQPQRFGVMFNLDGCLEKDHSMTNEENHKHRVDIYAESIGIKTPQEWNWSPSQMLINDTGFERNEKFKYIGLQIRGSALIKSLKPDVVKKIADILSKKYRVVLLDNDKDRGFEGPNIINTCGKLNVYQCTALLSKLDACITMDSGMLWMAHVANCPVLTILGPTREHERVALHPQYPEKAKSISISQELVGCQPCFETKTFCKGAMHCMNSYDSDKLVAMIEQKISEIVGV